MSDASDHLATQAAGEPWNKGRLVGQKPPLKLQEIWAIRIRQELGKRVRDLALLNLAIDSKLRGCDLVRLRVRDVAQSDHVMPRATVIQQKTGRPVRFELTDQTREAVGAWIGSQHLPSGSFLFPSRNRRDRHRDSPVRPDRPAVSLPDRTRPHGLRNALPAPDEGDADLPAH